MLKVVPSHMLAAIPASLQAAFDSRGGQVVKCKIEVREMRIVSLFLILLVALSCSGLSQEHPSQFETLNGGVIPIEELARGRWALGFVVFPGCPACEEFLLWFSRAAQAFPEISFLLVAPEATPELRAVVEEQPSGIPVLLDRDGMLGAWLGVERAPTVLLSVKGVYIDRLDWPFTEGTLFRKLAESLLVEVPSPKELLGQPAPDFETVDVKGTRITLAELPRPFLLVFFSLGCAPCWEILPMLGELSQEVTVALTALLGEAGLLEDDRERLEGFLDEVEEQGGAAVVLLDRWIEGRGFKIAMDYKVAQSPTFILIDEKGVITGVWEGRLEAEGLLEKVRTALAESR